MLLGRARVMPPEEAQRRLKADLLMEAAAALGLDALGIGEGELVFGLDFLTEGAARHGLPYVSANLADPATGELLFPPARTVEAGEVVVGVTAVTMEMRELDQVRFLEPVEAVRAAVETLRADSDLVVVLSHLGIDADRRLAEQVDGIDLILGSHSRRYRAQPLVVGRTAILQAGSMGKQLGELDIEVRRGGAGWWFEGARERALRRVEQLQGQLDGYDRQIAEAGTEEAKDRLRRVRLATLRRLDDLVVPPEDDGRAHRMQARHVPMNPAVPSQPAMAARVARKLEELGLVPIHSRSGRPSGAWVGGSRCIACHREHHDDWRSTGHAKAWRTLVQERRQFDLDCWSCHVTGAERPGGPATPQEAGLLRNVQCEACHGPGRQHIDDPEGGRVVRSPGEALCLECHTPEQTEGRFVYEEYLPKVGHRELKAR